MTGPTTINRPNPASVFQATGINTNDIKEEFKTNGFVARNEITLIEPNGRGSFK